MLLGLQPQNVGLAFSPHTQAILLTLPQQGFWVCRFLETPPWPGPHRLTGSSPRPAGHSISPEEIGKSTRLNSSHKHRSRMPSSA